METTLTPRRPAERAERQPGSERAPSTASSDVPKGPTPNEALERAQTLWNTGAREAAIDLLQDAVGVAERAGAGAAYPQGNPVLLPLVRELTRLQLAESRHGAVWDVLTRLEPQLGTASDLWAIRGNVAQRLGRHQDSVHAYMVALQSRPNEQRWLLGAAVSLAALGQTSSAADMADKARAVGVVSPDVLAYLRQMGVPLKDK
jgi:tetratricopeptide (TPR) repeat protein